MSIHVYIILGLKKSGIITIWRIRQQGIAVPEQTWRERRLSHKMQKRDMITESMGDKQTSMTINA